MQDQRSTIIWSAIERMLREENCKSRILLDTVESSEYTVGHGLREGSVLSPILYAVFVDGIVDRLEKNSSGRSRVGVRRTPAEARGFLAAAIATTGKRRSFILVALLHAAPSGAAKAPSIYALRGALRYGSTRRRQFVCSTARTGGSPLPISTDDSYIIRTIDRFQEESFSPGTWGDRKNQDVPSERATAGGSDGIRGSTNEAGARTFTARGASRSGP